MEPSDGFEAEFVQLVLGDHQARRGGVVLLARIARGDDAAFERAQLAQRFHARVGAIAFVVREDDRIALLLRHADRHEFVVEQPLRSEEHTSELQSLMRISYAVFCLKKKKKNKE